VYYLRYKDASTVWDSVDDLQYVRNFKTVTDEITGKTVFDSKSLKHLEDEDGFYSIGNMNGWHLSVQKKLLEKIDKLESDKLELIKRIEKLEEKINN
jgi:hypothetical protein